MSQFRAKRLDIGCFVNKWVIRDHTKRKVFAEYETERYVLFHLLPEQLDHLEGFSGVFGNLGY